MSYEPAAAEVTESKEAKRSGKKRRRGEGRGGKAQRNPAKMIEAAAGS